MGDPLVGDTPKEATLVRTRKATGGRNGAPSRVGKDSKPQLVAAQKRIENDGVHKLGERARELRVQKGWTLEELSERSGVSRSALSKLERDQVSPSYDIIMRLSNGLGMSVVDFFGTAPRQNVAGRRAVTRADEGMRHQAKGYLYRLLCEDLSSKRMLPFRATIEASTFEEAGGYVRHDGEECLFVISGRVAFHTEHYAPTELGPGDCIYIDSQMGHACVSLGDEPAEVFWVTVQN